ncbi:hypothetical protein ABZ260_00265 [Streptosporangium sp. NPDC006013]|uniref:hypothetical protein n=1 Tax=Streptosporangium sp. NPDC006013 TaxID=3155596 RepID=UPI0033AE0ABA
MSRIIEDRLRDAMAARARTVQDDGPPPPLPGPRRLLWGRWTLPIAVAVATVAVMAGIGVTVRGGGSGRPPVLAPAIAPAPPFYVAAVVTSSTVKTKNATHTSSTRGPLGVYDSRTGERTAWLPALDHSQVAGLGDGRTFFVAGREREGAPLRFYRITLTSDGEIGERVALSLPADLRTETLDVLAASPDGRKLAYSVSKPGTDRIREVRVADVVTGEVRRWRTAKSGFIYRMAWVGGARTLVFSWQGHDRPFGQEAMLLDTSVAGRDLLSAKPVDGDTTFFAARPGGSSFVTQEGGRNVEAPSLVEFSVTTGRRVRAWVPQEWFKPVAFDASGRVLLGIVRGGAPARLDGQRVTRIKTPELPQGQDVRLETTW